APSPGVAKEHPNWVRLIKEEEITGKRDAWPPEQFRRLAGPYKAYSRPHEPREKERQNLPKLTFHPNVQPMAHEPVVATGEELHRYCKSHNILFLIYA